MRAYPETLYPGRRAWLSTDRTQARLVVEGVGTVATASARSTRGAVRRLEELLEEELAQRRTPPVDVDRAVRAVMGALFNMVFGPMPPPFTSELALLRLDAIPTEEALRAAWRRRARETHPDAGGSAEDFAAVRAAAERLAAHIGVKL